MKFYPYEKCDGGRGGGNGFSHAEGGGMAQKVLG